MSKKLYHLPLIKTREFIKENKTDINKITRDNTFKEYALLLGKSRYMIAIEEFLKRFKIDKEPKRFLKTVNYFNSKEFLDEVLKLLNFYEFEGIEKKEFFYSFCYLFETKDKELFKNFFEMTFLHYASFVSKNSDIHLNYESIVRFLAKQKGSDIKESFGTKESNQAYFKLTIDNHVVIKNGKSVKTLRKKAYKEMLDKFI
jgi:hypothetical protein